MPIPAPETEVVTRWKVACDGGEGALGHPRVWLTIPHEAGFVECGYCDKRFVIDRAHAHADH
ncbi:MAG: zinc-finger domain-containing protein [Alphaproteobacteria bacterium HGW-Alphaproteobacteria-6]|nr:MAG: zinc-finger domain-containing protein [Alphaproteobacteria bacterium HGW-Alphaproteobacteria-6]